MPLTPSRIRFMNLPSLAAAAIVAVAADPGSMDDGHQERNSRRHIEDSTCSPLDEPIGFNNTYTTTSSSSTSTASTFSSSSSNETSPPVTHPATPAVDETMSTSNSSSYSLSLSSPSTDPDPTDSLDADEEEYTDRQLAIAIAVCYIPDPLCSHWQVARKRLRLPSGLQCRFCRHEWHAFGWVYICRSCGLRMCHNCRPRMSERCWGSIGDVLASRTSRRIEDTVRIPGAWDDQWEWEREDEYIRPMKAMWRSLGGVWN